LCALAQAEINGSLTIDYDEYSHLYYTTAVLGVEPQVLNMRLSLQQNLSFVIGSDAPLSQMRYFNSSEGYDSSKATKGEAA
jgi:hypothetical protein